jgi:hypothetical protein
MLAARPQRKLWLSQEDIEPGHYSLRHVHSRVLWETNLSARDVKYPAEASGRVGAGTEEKPTVVMTLTEIGQRESFLGEMVLKVLPGIEAGRILVEFQHMKR